MRHYTTDSPEAMGRLVALTLLADGAIDASELKQLDKKDSIRRLGLSEASFDKLIHELCDDMLASAYRTSEGQLELNVSNIDHLLAEVKNPVLQKQVLRMMLDIANADLKLTGGEAVLIAEAMKFWGIDLYEVADCSIPYRSVRAKAGRELANA
jgi:uncharacterized tellurite resistance protein B-like protein